MSFEHIPRRMDARDEIGNEPRTDVRLILFGLVLCFFGAATWVAAFEHWMGYVGMGVMVVGGALTKAALMPAGAALGERMGLRRPQVDPRSRDPRTQRRA